MHEELRDTRVRDASQGGSRLQAHRFRGQLAKLLSKGRDAQTDQRLSEWLLPLPDMQMGRRKTGRIWVRCAFLSWKARCATDLAIGAHRGIRQVKRKFVDRARSTEARTS